MLKLLRKFGASGGTRTPSLQVRSLLLYPVELRTPDPRELVVDGIWRNNQMPSPLAWRLGWPLRL
jgi:hypothetical protein